MPEGKGKLTKVVLEKFTALFKGGGYDLTPAEVKEFAERIWKSSKQIFQSTVGLTVEEFKRFSVRSPEIAGAINETEAGKQAARKIAAQEATKKGVTLKDIRGSKTSLQHHLGKGTSVRELGEAVKKGGLSGAPGKALLTKILKDPKALGAMGGIEALSDVALAESPKLRATLEKLGVTGPELEQQLANIKGDVKGFVKTGGEEALPGVARKIAPLRSAPHTGVLGWLTGKAGAGIKDKTALEALTKGVGSKAGRLGAGALRGGIPLLLLSGLFKYGDIKAGLGLDSEFNAQIGALESATTATTSDALLEQYEEEQLLAQGKSRLMRADPMAMQFLMQALEGGIPQKLTANEIMIGAQSNSAMQGLAGDDIARMLMNA